MKESRFIEQNKEKWQEAETLLKHKIEDPEKLSTLFIQVVDDLSYSRTFYPNRSVRVYLNKIAREYFSIIYGHKKKEKHSKFWLFWLDELPQVILHCKRELLISLFVFVLSMTIGVFSAYNDPEFVNTILGTDYVTMTKKNIEAGDPMAVYKQSQEVEMFLGITFNNLMVAFRTYVLGIFLCIGTLGSLLSNGVMVGCFQYFFVGQGLFVESALTIWLHGTLEISSIILAGGAGLTLGLGVIFPGTYSRLQSLQLSGIRSLKLMLGIAPVFVLAGIIESFLTRYTEAPTFLKLLLILLSATFIIGYFVVYPWRKSKKGFMFPLKEIKLAASQNDPPAFGQIKNNADLFKDTFQFYSRHSGAILSWSFLATLAVCTTSFYYHEEALLITESDWWVELLNEMFFALSTQHPVSLLVNSLATSLVLYRVMKLIDAEYKRSRFSVDIKSFMPVFIISLLMYGSIYLGAWGVVLLIAIFAVLIFVAFATMTGQNNPGATLQYRFAQFWKNSNQGVSLQLAVLLLSFSFLLVLSAPLLYMHLSIMKWNFVGTDAWSKNFIAFIEIFLKTFSFYLVLPVIVASFCYLYFSQEEVTNASNLKDAIAKMGSKTSTQKRR